MKSLLPSTRMSELERKPGDSYSRTLRHLLSYQLDPKLTILLDLILQIDREVEIGCENDFA